MTGLGLPEGLAEEVLTAAFPFHLLVGAEGCVGRMGRSLRRVAPELALGRPVQPHLRITTPRDTGWVRGPGAALPPGLVLVVDVSAGIALAPDHGDGGEVLMRHADVAMYAAKRNHADPTEVRPRHASGAIRTRR